VLPYRDGEFEGLDSASQVPLSRFVNEQVNVLRHDDMADHTPFVPLAHAFKRRFEQVAACCVAEVG
jgi:hypothetical protein